jgi:4a-hydroxytetrahydrobiopterin dehydratase
MWEEKENKLVKSYRLSNFRQAINFIAQIAEIAEMQNHHPEIWNLYNKVKITLTTHDAGNTVTEKDRVLANNIDDIFKAYE